MKLVIGSGPAGVACAQALLSRGEKVCVVDIGATENVLSKAELFKSSSGAFWNEKRASVVKHEAAFLLSVEKGGLSNVWGAGLSSYLAEEINGVWPFQLDNLAKYYKKLYVELNGSVAMQDLQELFPFFSYQPKIFNFSAQAEVLYKQAAKNAQKLRRNGIHVGSARLAAKFDSCTYCGKCIYGCPHHLIYSSINTLVDLEKRQNFSYQNNIEVITINEEANQVRLIARDCCTGKKKEILGSQLFIACGPIFTAKILLASLGLYNQALPLKNSQHFMLPGFMKRGIEKVESLQHHSMSQMVIELFDKTRSPYACHVQLYTYMKLYKQYFKGKRLLYPFMKPFMNFLLNRMVVLQGYLHSNESVGLNIVLEKHADGETLVVKAEAPKKSKSLIKNYMKLLRRNRKALGFSVIPAMVKVSLPGVGNHFGGSFPMSKNPRALETDIWGRLPCFKRVHIVDASIFPTIPAQSPTLTIMANAARIASECELSAG